MDKFPVNPTILMVTPEVTYLPKGMGDIADNLSAKAGGLAGCVCHPHQCPV